MTRFFLIALFAVGLWFGWDDWRQREIKHEPGMLAAAAPVQRNIATAAPIRHGKFTLTPRAEFTVTARVLAAERYRMDAIASLVPRDLALGWGPMSDSSVIEQMQISQSGRFYFSRSRTNALPIPYDLIAVSMANMHLIAANVGVARIIDRARVGHIIELEGQLVDVRGDDGLQMNTSLTRTDLGGGACEIVYVERATVR
jgi:hypothetical protein